MSEVRASYTVAYTDTKALKGAVRAEVRRLVDTDSTSYTGPDTSLIRAVIEHSELSQQGVADLLRVNVSTVRRWTAKSEQRQFREIPYVAWFFLLQYSELATYSQLIDQHQTTAASQVPQLAVPAQTNAARKRASNKKTTEPVATFTDSIGLVRPVNFKDFPAAVSVIAEAKTLPVMNRLKWKTSPKKHMAVWEAEGHQQQFRQLHSEATIEQRYKVSDKTILELYATYDDERADHRVIYQAKNH